MVQKMASTLTTARPTKKRKVMEVYTPIRGKGGKFVAAKESKEPISEEDKKINKKIHDEKVKQSRRDNTKNKSVLKKLKKSVEILFAGKDDLANFTPDPYVPELLNELEEKRLRMTDRRAATVSKKSSSTKTSKVAISAPKLNLKLQPKTKASTKPRSKPTVKQLAKAQKDYHIALGEAKVQEAKIRFKKATTKVLQYLANRKNYEAEITGKKYSESEVQRLLVENQLSQVVGNLDVVERSLTFPLFLPFWFGLILSLFQDQVCT